MIIVVHKSVSDYAAEVYRRIFDAGFEVEFDEDSPDTLNKRIRNAQLAQFNFILVIGQQEKSHGTVNVRTRDNQVRFEGLFPIFFFIDFLTFLRFAVK